MVVLAWDTLNGKAPARTDLLGYAIERAELDLAGNEVERYWMRGIKRFKDRDKGLPPGTPVSTAEHPIQSFLWADYTARRAPATCSESSPCENKWVRPLKSLLRAVIDTDPRNADDLSTF